MLSGAWGGVVCLLSLCYLLRSMFGFLCWLIACWVGVVLLVFTMFGFDCCFDAVFVCMVNFGLVCFRYLIVLLIVFML